MADSAKVLQEKRQEIIAEMKLIGDKVQAEKRNLSAVLMAANNGAILTA